MLKINLTKHAAKKLDKLPTKHAKQIAKKLMSLREEPLPQDSKKLQNSIFYRVDSGEYRIIYQIVDGCVEVLLIGKRNDGEVYQKFDRIK